MIAVVRSRTFAGANALTLFLYAALGAALFFLPFHLVQVEGYSATPKAAPARDGMRDHQPNSRVC